MKFTTSRQRFYEILPASLAWGTIVGMFLFSYFTPTAVAIFIILFDTYWLLKSLYLSLHLRATYQLMRQNLKVDWLKELEGSEKTREGWRDLYHLIILPMYTEPYEVVREGIESMLQSAYPKEKLLLVLATEERAGQTGQEIAKKIEDEYGQKFGGFLVTTHPKDREGEIPGKGSNEAWAGEQAKKELLDKKNISYKQVLTSIFDIDTQIPTHYFSRLSYVFLTTENPYNCIYQPIPLFTNNIFEAPALARVVSFSCTFWQMMQQVRVERLTSFSSQSIPFQTLLDIGFWHRDVVSEDSRIFWQGYLHYHGDFRVEPLLFPVSMDANVAPTFWGTCKNLYKQQRRWGWGAENIPYLFEGLDNDKKIPARKKWYWRLNLIEGFHSWATNSLMIFALGWLPVVLGDAAFRHSLLSYSLPKVTRFIVSLSMIGIVGSAALGLILLPEKKPKHFKNHHYIWYFFQWVLIPFSLIVFGSFPGLEAQTRLALGGKWRLGFWVTPKSRKK